MILWFARLLGRLESTPLALAIRSSLWCDPIVEIFRRVGFALLVGTIVMLDKRPVGWSRFLPMTGLAWHLLPSSVANLL